MNTTQIRKRVLQNGKTIRLDKFTWDFNTRTFSSNESNLVLDFLEIDNINFKTGSDCTFKTGSDCTFDTEYNCTFDTEYNCRFKTGYDCNFKTYSGCNFKTASRCTFDTGFDCTFDTGSDCVLKTSYTCNFKTGYDCVIVRRDIFESIIIEENEIIQSNPSYTPGYLSSKEGDKFFLNRDESLGEHIIADKILSRVISRKDNIIKVMNFNENDESYIIEHNDNYYRGQTIEEAHELILKEGN